MTLKSGVSGSWASMQGGFDYDDAGGEGDLEGRLLQLAYRAGRAAAMGWREEMARRGAAPPSGEDCAAPESRPISFREQAKTPYLTCVQAAEYLGLARATLDKLRVVGGGPKFRKHGRRIHYHVEDLDDWSNARARRSTSQA